MTLGDTLMLAAMIAFLLATLIPAMWAATDAARLADTAWKAAGLSKSKWVVLPPLAAFACAVFGPVAAWVYYSKVRPQVLANLQNDPKPASDGGT